MAPDDPQRRLRFRFTKHGKIRFTSHRDVARMWERALRRSHLPVALSQGYNPHPLVSFGLALPTGCESLGEYLDIRLDPVQSGEPSLDHLTDLLTDLLPEGIEVQVAAVIPMTEGSLQQEIASCDWQLEVFDVTSEVLAGQVERLLAASSLTVQRERKGRPVEDDIRPAILALAVDPEPGESTGHYPQGRLSTRLATHPRGVRPSDLVAALGTEMVLARACRTHQWIERDGATFEPLPVSELGTGPVVTHAHGRAS